MKNSTRTITFALDSMFGRLARYLLHLGYNCLYRAEIRDDRLAERARNDNRVLLTRDRDFVRKDSLKTEVYVLRDQPLQANIESLVNAFNLVLEPDFFFTRCSDCNQLLESVKKELVTESVPEETADWVNEYYRCPQCNKTYWKGSHYRDLVEKLGDWGLLNAPTA